MREARLYGLSEDGIRRPLFWGIFCEYCGRDITTEVKEFNFFRCSDCYDVDMASAQIVRGLPRAETWQGRRQVRRVILALENPALYAESIALVAAAELLDSAERRYWHQYFEARSAS